MSAVLENPTTQSHPTPNADASRSSGAVQANPSSRGGFLFSPWIDLIFVANLLWPLVVFVDVFGGTTAHEGLLFWQIYFITAPHRWITIVLVAVDHHKSQDRRWLFGALALAILVVCLGLQLGTGSLLCLGMIDYVWNAWHFSSQHHGIYRIYQRRSDSKPRVQSDPFDRTSKIATEQAHSRRLSTHHSATFQKFLFRGFLLYAIARVAGVGWPEGPFPTLNAITQLDWPMLLIPVGFCGVAVQRSLRSGRESLAGTAYLFSVMALFTCLLLAAHYENSRLVIQLALASAIFHSMEYMSIVTWSMKKSGTLPNSNPLTRLSKIWMLFLVAFVLVIGLGNYLMSRGYFEIWVLANLVVAFWHYCFDGMLWKSPKPKAQTGGGA
ncbi:hypothetical protein [Rhodopirellula halodulae]|uniref:hypothetical protein n=1 Tax=Rhodopirellula halodulae TaxID=2894198 RepID=UPI001E5CE9AB|nr:hypothetical protein [Rhodopirellula sp. JC737]MCC9657419.1 hypothetical protein [Rhodopirellula sp. JC737]